MEPRLFLKRSLHAVHAHLPRGWCHHPLGSNTLQTRCRCHPALQDIMQAASSGAEGPLKGVPAYALHSLLTANTAGSELRW